VDKFLEHIIESAVFKIGRCAPVSNAYNATLVAGCNKILDPFVSILSAAFINVYLSDYASACLLWTFYKFN